VKAEPVEALWGLNFKRGYHMPLIFFVRVLSYWRAVNLEMVDASLRLLDRFEHRGGNGVSRNGRFGWASRSRPK
jgi:hypothetical protein